MYSSDHLMNVSNSPYLLGFFFFFLSFPKQLHVEISFLVLRLYFIVNFLTFELSLSLAIVNLNKCN